MIQYIIADNPDDRVVRRAIYTIGSGGIIAFPTDTNWVLGADVNSKAGVELLYRLKKVSKKHHFSLLCDSISMVNDYAEISNSVFKQIKGKLPGPYTFILPPSRGLPKIIRNYRKDREIGIRIPESLICKKLIESLGRAIISTSITLTTLGMEGEDNEEIFSYQIESSLDHSVPLIIDPGEFQFKGQSSVIDFSKGDIPSVLREGAGDTVSFH